MYVKQKTEGVTIVVIGNASQALADLPELFEQVEGEPPQDAEYLNYTKEE